MATLFAQASLQILYSDRELSARWQHYCFMEGGATCNGVLHRGESRSRSSTST